jgi:hypothetical protein
MAEDRVLTGKTKVLGEKPVTVTTTNHPWTGLGWALQNDGQFPK